MTRSSFLLVAHPPGGRPALDETRGAVIASAAKQSRTAQQTPRRRLLRRFAPRNDEPRFLVSRKTKPAYFCDCDANGAGLRPHREPPCPPRRPRLGRREPRELDPAPQPRQDRANELSADALLRRRHAASHGDAARRTRGYEVGLHCAYSGWFVELFRRHRRGEGRWDLGPFPAGHRLRPPFVFPFAEQAAQLRQHAVGEQLRIVCG